MDPDLLRRTAEIAAEYLASLPERPVRAGASLEELRSGLRLALEDRSRPALEVIEELVVAADPGLVGTQSPRYFGFVIGGGLDAAIAADWLTSVWDQNAAGYPGGVAPRPRWRRRSPANGCWISSGCPATQGWA